MCAYSDLSTKIFSRLKTTCSRFKRSLLNFCALAATYFGLSTRSFNFVFAHNVEMKCVFTYLLLLES